MRHDDTNGDTSFNDLDPDTPRQHTRASGGPPSADAIEAWLLAHLAGQMGVDTAEIDVDEPFDSYGLSSKDLVIMSGDLETWLGVMLPPTIAYEYVTVAALARHLAGVVAAAPAAEAPSLNSTEPIVVVGLGCRFPGAANPQAFWRLLHDGVDAISDVPAARRAARTFTDRNTSVPGEPNTRWGGFLDQVDQFDPHFFGIGPREAVRMDPQQRILLEVAWEALEDAGQSPTDLAGTATGVFVGIATRDYSQLQLDDIEGMDVYASTGNASSIAANRLSYLLDLRGPSLAIDTACSSSLVAIHLACQSLRGGESNLALAGGVNVILSPDWTIPFAQAGLLAPDGHCKTFDADADGYVRGEGCGIVVLKRLSDAQRDGDTILALIRGSAVNQDGRSNGLVAPNGLAQEAAIRQALENAGVAAAQIGYVETHGTGTALGDPIELNALKAVLMQGRRQDQPCVVGSVKTNIGHLEAAAGIAGMIKVVLALRHATIPAHLHFKTLNPHIILDGAPLTIPTRPQPWEPGAGRRFAGVSSFGFGGTNAHIVVEEAPLAAPSGAARPWQLLTLSAKTEPALETMTAELVAELRARPDLQLADVVYTHQAGRKAFGQRRMLVCRDGDDAVSALESRDLKRIVTAASARRGRSLVFMFPGLGDHYVNMALDLYQAEPVFCAQVDQCAELLRPHLGLDLREVLYPPTQPAGDSSAARQGIDLRKMLGRGADQPDPASQKLNRTELAHPALFVIEYALAQLWLAWGLRPQALIGYSIGEYVAACLAGVLSLEDALALVARRSQLIEALPGGAMLAVPLTEREIQPLLNEQLSLAAINGASRCVVAGTADAIAALERDLAARDLVCRRLQTAHAFHSRMMEPIRDSFAELVKTISLRPPQTPYLSNVTGTWITAEEATDPAYWARHLCQTVRFADGLDELAKEPEHTLLEVGPGQTLSSLAWQYAESASTVHWTVLPSLRHSYDRQADLPFVLGTLGKLWLAGHAVDWPAFYAGQQRRRISLPPHPFERQRYWIEPRHAPPNRKETAAMSHPEQEARHKTTRRDSILATIRGIVARLLQTEPARVDIHVPFLEMGADSIVLVQAIRTIEKTFGIEIAIRQLFEELTTIGDVAAYIDQHLGSDWAPEEQLQAETAITAPAERSQPAEAAPASTQPASVLAAPHLPPGLPARTNGADAGLEQIVTQQLDVFAQITQVMAQQLAALGGQASGPQAAVAPPAHAVALPQLSPSSGNGSAHQAHNGTPPAATAVPERAGQLAAPDKTPNKPYVPYQPIKVEARFDPLSGLNPLQRSYLEGFVERYTRRTQTSKQLTQRYRSVLADNRASVGFRFSIKDMLYPIVGERSQGSRIWDVDGNEYIDLSMGFGVNLFGHAAPFIQQAIAAQLQQGIQLGPQSNMAGQVAELICELTGVERVTFCNSGTEAVMMALRLARTATGRKKIAMFAGSFHGEGDGTLAVADEVNGKLVTAPMAPGVMPGAAEHTLVLEYGEPRSLDIIREHAHELAAVLVEPVQSRRPDLQPREFLHQLRTLTRETGVALIFDEMITGFRIHPGGAQAWFGVQADLATYGKVVGGGMPLGIVAGKAAYMDGIDGGMWQYGDGSYPRTTTTFFAGTFCKHPLTMAATRAVLQHLKEQGPALQERLNQRTTHLVEQLNQLFAAEQVPIHTVQFGSLFRFTFSSNMDLFFYHLIEKGLYVWEGRNMFLTTAHTDDDLDQVVRAIRASIRDLREGGILPERPAEAQGSEVEPKGELELAPASAGVADNMAHQQEPDGPIPLNGSQRQLWTLARLDEDALRAYNESIVVDLQGPLDPAALRSAVQQVVDRHEALRTTISSDGNLQNIAPALAVEVALVDFSDRAEPAHQEQALEWIAAENLRAFDLVRGPLFCSTLVKLAEQQHLLLLTAHHIVIDGLSLILLAKELSTLYSAAVGGSAVQLAPPVQFRTFLARRAECEQSDAMAAHEEYWLQRFADPIPVLDLQIARPRPLVMSYRGASRSLSLEAPLCDELRRLSRAQRSTLFMTFFAGYLALLHRLSDKGDLIVGMPVSLREEHEHQDLIGYTINLLPVRSTLNGNPTFREHLAGLKRTLFDALEHSEYPFARLLERLNPPRDASRPPIITMTFNLDRATDLPTMTGLELELITLPIRTAKFDLSLNVLEIENAIRLDLNYNAELFDDDTIGRMLAQFRMLLKSVVANPDQYLADLPLLSSEEREQLLVEWNATTTAYPRDACIHQLFEEQVARDPSAVAVTFGAEPLSYQDLQRRSNQLAHYLRTCGVGPDSLVAVYLDRSFDLVIALLAILKAGSAYVSLDRGYPGARLAFMLGDTQARLIVTHQNLASELPAHAAQVVCLDTDWPAIAQSSDTSPLNRTTADHLAYVSYTSGSTGVPKGVRVIHRAVVRLVKNTNFATMTPDDVFLQLAPVAFDASTLEVWGSLLNGARLVVYPPSMPTLDELAQLLVEERVTTLWLTAGFFHQMVDYQLDSLRGVRQMLAGGDTLSVPHVQKLLAGRADGVVINGYGPTENTTFTCCYRMTNATQVGTSVPIGRPIANTQVYILDRRLQPVPVSVPGELYIGGDGLARDYLNCPDLTAERFIPNPFAPDTETRRHGDTETEDRRSKIEDGGSTIFHPPSSILHPRGERLYRTGDLARYLPDGEIEFLGRIDTQVKIRGFRIELGEIETVLAQHPAVRDVVVVAREDVPGSKRLAAYVVLRTEGRGLSGADSSVLSPQSSVLSELREFLQEKLPDYMVPTAFVVLDSLPLTPNGKVDRRALPAPDAGTADGADTFVAPRTPVEQALAEIWAQVLGREHVGIHTDFFELGGDSILSIQIVARANQVGLRFIPKQLFQYPTIAKLAAVVDIAAPLHAEQGLVHGTVAFTPIQRWFFGQNQPDPHHFNQAVLLAVVPSIRPELLAQAIQVLAEHHDGLRLRYTYADGTWTQQYTDALERLASFQQVDLSDISDTDLAAVLEKRAAELQSSLDLAMGPLISVALFQLGPDRPARLLIVIHHLVVDGVSWRVLIEDLHEIYRQLSDGHAIQLPPKTTSFKYWAERLNAYAQSDALDIEYDFWLDQPWENALALPMDDSIDGAATGNTIASMAEVVVALDQEATEALLYQVPEVYHTQINEVLLTALARAFGRWTGSWTLLVDLEGHGREELFDDVDLSRTVGWFTTIFPVLLTLDAAEQPGEMLKSVKEQLRRIPNHGVGYGLLRYLRADDDAGRLAALRPAEVSFNYLGQLDRMLEKEALFALTSEPYGSTVSPRANREHLLDITGQVIGGKLELSWAYSRAVHRPETVERLAQWFLEALRDLIAYCLMPDVGSYSPSDFPLAQVDQDALDAAMSLFEF